MQSVRVGGALLGLGLLATQVAVAQPAEAPPEEASVTDSGPQMLRYPPSTTRGWVLGGGFGLTAAAYAAGMACGYGWGDVPGADALKVPVVGPWVALGQSGCAPDQEDCTAMLVLRTILTTLDGLAQLGGVGLILEGFLMTTEADAPADERSTTTASGAARPPPVQVALAPMISPAEAGVSFDLRF